jgi:hypothetical protein
MVRFVLLAMVLAGCGGSAGPSTFSAINQQVLQPSCALSSSCHKEAHPSQGNLDLKTDPYTALVNAPSQNPLALSMGQPRVKPGDSANSLLYIKLTLPSAHSAGHAICNPEVDTSGNQIPPTQLTDYGSCMPQTSSPLDQSTIDGIKLWIDSGALNN